MSNSKAPKKVLVTNVKQWKSVVEKKRELGERLMWQYMQDFDSSKGKSGDMKMVFAAQKSGTEADNPIANLRSLDALLGMVTSKEVSNNSERNQPPLLSSCLPGGYNPRHREPLYCNGDRASWWELMVLASHVHPSVATMAGTLLFGTNIVYNGKPLNDLCLTAFLDKFMEKKPKQSTWHGGSQIEPAKKLDMSNHIIGPEILSLAESDVPPEDLVFHKFYVSKMTSTKKLKKKKKKKKLTEEEAAEELFDVDVGGDESGVDVEGGDESDNEQIENMLDAADGAIELEDGEYDYDDLDKVANDDDDDDDLLGNASDVEMDMEMDMDMDMLDGEEEHAASPNEDFVDDDNDIGDKDDVGGGDKRKHGQGKRKKAVESPFASLEEYEHLLNQDEPNESESNRKRKSKPRNEKKQKKP